MMGASVRTAALAATAMILAGAGGKGMHMPGFDDGGYGFDERKKRLDAQIRVCKLTDTPPGQRAKRRHRHKP